MTLTRATLALPASPALATVLAKAHEDAPTDANLTLSQGRARAVVAALTRRGLAASRSPARGVASCAPIGPNARGDARDDGRDDGRAKTPRVEMILQ